MNYKKTNHPLVHLPRIPFSKIPALTQEEFWQQKEKSGAINAFRQLNSTLHRGGRKVTVLPGGKLKPLFKNDSHSEISALGSNSTLPTIPGLGSSVDTGLKQILSGSLDDLPPPCPTTVKIYLCSNYEDMKYERTELMKTAVPELQDYCSQLGLQFQLVDLHWGVSVAEHSWTAGGFSRQLRQTEISDCQRLSIGPHFVCLLGDCYGIQQIPDVLTEAEYKTVTEISHKQSPSNYELLTRYYIKDENASPVCYVCQKPEGLSELNVLHSVVLEAFRLAVSENKLTEERFQELTISALEEDIRQGILDTKDPRSHCICYHREFRNINSDLSQAASEYFDTTVDEAGITKLNISLKTRVTKLAEKAEEHLGVVNFHNYYLGWSENELIENSEFQPYLKKMVEDFVRDIKELIGAGYKLVAKEISAKRNLSSLVHQEVLFHMQKCKTVIADYTRSRENVLFSHLKAFLQDPLENSRPFIIWGQSGMGKTTTAGVIAQQLKTWFGEDCVVVLRFLGSTWQSASIHRTINSITIQICLAYGIHCPAKFESFDTLYHALVTFRSVLDQVSKKFASSHPLFIVLDAIDQLHPFQESMKALWAMRDLPPNVHMILSTTDKLGEKDLLSALINTITVPTAVMEVSPLDDSEVETFTEQFMVKSGRKLSEQQMAVFRKAISRNPQPLYITQLMLKALRFQSTQQVNSDIPTTIEGLFVMQVESLEQEVGESIVRCFVAILTASPVGVLECELLDLLSNNKEVMAEVYSLHHHPSESIFLFPQKLLIKMKHAMRDFLCEHLLLGRVALAWNHREIYQAASNFYNVIYPGIAEVDIVEGATDFSLMIHEQFANMFLPENRTDLLSELPAQLANRVGEWTVLNQPQEVHIENVQKLNRALMHLSIMVPMEGLARIKQNILFNFKWLHTKLQSAGLVAVLQDVIDMLLLVKGLALEGVLEENEEDEEVDIVWKEIDLLYQFLQLAVPSLLQSSDNLAVEILGRLFPLRAKYSQLRSLMEGAEEHLMACQGPCIMPLYGCLPGPGGVLRYTFPGATHVIDYRERSGLAVTFSQRSGVRVWRLDSTQQIHEFPVNKEQAQSGVLPGNVAPFIVIGHYSHLNHLMEVGVWSVDTGVAVVNTNLPHRFEAVALSLDDQVLFLATVIQEESKTNGGTMKRYILGIKAKTKEIVYTFPCIDHHADGVRRIIPIAGLRDGQSTIITLGGHKSKDLVCWTVDKVAMVYHVEFEYFLDMFHINEEKNIGIGCNVDQGVLIVLNLADGAIIQTVQHAVFQNVQDVYVSRSGDFIVAATDRDGVSIHSIPKKSQVKTVARKVEEVGTEVKPSKVTMDEMEHFVFIGYHSGVIDIYSIVTGELLSVLTGHTKAVNTLHVLADHCVLSASDDNEAKLWHYEMAVLDHLTNHMMSGDEQFDCALAHKTKATNPTIQTDVNRTRMMCCLFLAKNDETIVTGSYNGPIQVWNTDSPEHPYAEITEKCEHGLTDLYLTYKDMLLVGHCVDPNLPDISRLQVWNFDSGRPIPFDKDVTVMIFTSCAFPSGDRILTISPSSDDRQKGIIVAIYDLFEMKCLASLQCNIYSSMDSTNLRLLGFTSETESNDMELESVSDNDMASEGVPSATNNKLYAVLDYFPSDSLSFFFTFVVHGEGMKDISMDHHEPIHLDTVSPKCNIVMPGNVCVSGMKDGSLVMWNVASQKVITNFCDDSRGRFLRSRQLASNVHVGPVTCLAPAQDDTHIVSGGADGKVKLWNLNNKTLIHTFSKHTEQIVHVSVSAGNLMTSASADSNIAVWDLEQKTYLCGFYAHDFVTDVIITKNRSKVVARVNEKHPSLLVLKLTGV